MDSKNIAIIPAKGSSKRLPKKNILPFLGRPTIYYTIDAAMESGLFDEVVVSSEDEEVIACISNLGCNIHRRAANLASDTARVVDVIRDVLDWCARKNKHFDCLCCLYPTAPLRDAGDIKESYKLLVSRKADYAIGVTEYEHSPFFAFNINHNSMIERRWPDQAALPHWEKPPVVVDNGSLYWMKVDIFLKTGTMTGHNTVGYKMPREKSVDIDTEEDFALAEYFAKTAHKKGLK